MCGIAGFSLSPRSKVNARALAHELLSAIEDRGTHASGFAAIGKTRPVVYKAPKPGSQLPLHDLSRRAKNVILHTRYATQGAASDNRNNHPVLSPGGNIALVHNGVISNDHMYRKQYGGPFDNLADVDSSVIPAVIETYGLSATEALEGYAAISWLDHRDSGADRGKLHIARLDFSPVAYTWLVDGSFVFASTPALLVEALLGMGHEFGAVFEMDEGDYFQVLGGVIRKRQTGLKMTEDWYTRTRFSSATAGGHGTSGLVQSKGIGSSFGRSMAWDEDDDEALISDDEIAERLNRWDEDYRSQYTSDDDDDDRLDHNQAMCYYLTLEDGSMEMFETLDEMENRLAWLSGQSLFEGCTFPFADKAKRWLNFVIDIGHISSAGTGPLMSWLEDTARIDYHESPGVYNLQTIREGVHELVSYLES